MRGCFSLSNTRWVTWQDTFSLSDTRELLERILLVLVIPGGLHERML